MTMLITASAVSCGVMQIDGVHDCIPALGIKYLLDGKATKVQKLKDKLAYLLDAIDEEGIYESVEVDWDMLNTYSLRSGHTYIFSDNNMGNGVKLAAFIKDNDLGAITESGWVRNPSSGQQINTWTWVYNGNKLATAKKKSKAKPNAS